jgi:ribosomal-protein-serine acetyltransferase
MLISFYLILQTNFLNEMILNIDNSTTLKQLKLSDSTDIFNLINSERDYLGKWLPFVALTKEITDTEQFIKSIIEAPDEKREYVFTIRRDNKFIGLIGFKDTDRSNAKTEIGYWLSETYQKQGIITNAVKELCNFAFNTLNINRVVIKCAKENIPSINVANRLGFVYEGTERDGEILTGGIYTDLKIFSMLKKEFKY